MDDLDKIKILKKILNQSMDKLTILAFSECLSQSWSSVFRVRVIFLKS